MRPLTLDMTAFGPFAGKETIDFQKLGSSPLFLINGPTGSGKTTILDAICFALYGQTTGDEREGHQMRCDFAAPDVLTKVELTFELSGKRYRILRIPQQQKPKTNGNGSTLQNTTAEFWDCSSSGVEQLIVASKVTDATAEIVKRTGLDADQFRQVIVLPQGKFRQLLMADSKDREHIFGQLFQTQIYKKLEDSLKARAAEIRRKVEDLNRFQQGILESEGLENRQALINNLEELQPQHQKLLKLKDEKSTQLLVSTKKLHEAEALLISFQDLAEVEIEKQQLVNQKDIIDVKRDQLQKAQHAQKIKPVFDQVERLKQALFEEDENFRINTQNQIECKQAFKDADANNTLAKLKGVELDGAKQKLSELNSYHDRAKQLADTQALLLKEKMAQNVAQESLTESELAAKTIINEREKLEGKEQDIRSNLSNLSDKRLELKQLDDQLDNKKELQDLQAKVQKNYDTLQREKKKGLDLKNAHEETEVETKRLELLWHQGQAAILAKELDTGQPCPVCGSNKHPSPAKSEYALTTQAELNQAKILQEQAFNKLNEARDKYKDLNKDAANLKNQCDQVTIKLGKLSDLSMTSLQQQHQTLTQSVKMLLDQQIESNAREKVINELKITEDQQKRQLETAVSNASKASIKFETAKSQVRNAELELPEQYREEGALQKAHAGVQTRVKTLENEIHLTSENYNQMSAKWEKAKAQEQSSAAHQRQTNQKLQEAKDVASGQLLESCFNTLQDYTKAKLDEADLNTLQNDISLFDAEYHRVIGIFDQQEKVLKNKKKPDVQAFKVVNKLASESKEIAENHWRELDKRLSSLIKIENKLEQTKTSQDKLEKDYALIGTLSDVSNGQTGDKVSLQRFVLSVLLDDVLLHASSRLEIMSEGRYRLVRKIDRTKGNKPSGLDLEVEDTYYGTVRAVETKSGGESFMAALALALGLSEVVQAHAGGIRLDTLFIDEGFGSLDAERLDLALSTLIDLQSSGRMIGVISHVDALREQIPKRLDVIPGRKGSTVQTIC